MAGSSSGGIDKDESGNNAPKNSNLSTSFTISFGDQGGNSTAKQKKLINSNVSAKRHVRTFSLPFTNDWHVTKVR